jgi:hypothetical protein
MSVCKKGLALESGIPVNLPLYPGECNPPREISVGGKANWTTSAVSTVGTLTSPRKCMTSIKEYCEPEVLIAVAMMNTIFMVAPPCSSMEVHEYFGGVYRLNPGNRRVSQASNKQNTHL